MATPFPLQQWLTRDALRQFDPDPLGQDGDEYWFELALGPPPP
jgi:hypothetical protein